jgi:hypothetical protein
MKTGFLMAPLTTAVTVRAPAAAAWELFVDTRRWPEWGPSVARVDCPVRCIGQGPHGRVQTAFGLWLSFQVTEFRAGHCWRWRVAGIAATGHRVEALGPDRCRVVFEVPVVAAPYLLVCRWAAQRIKKILERERQPA